MKKTDLKKILEHLDKDEIISKLVLDYSPKDIHEWLAAKYTSVNEKSLVISEKSIKTFKDNYLDVYSMIQEDISKTKQSITSSTQEQLQLAVSNNPTYKSKMIELASKEIDVRTMVAQLCVAVETRLAQVFDEIQEDPRNINTKVDRLLIDYGELLGNILEKYYKFTEIPNENVIQHKISLQAMDQHISVFYDVVKEILSQIDTESSLLFMELFHEKMSKLKQPTPEALPNTEVKLAEAKLLNETISNKLNS